MVVGLMTSKRTPPTTSRTPSRPLRMIPTANARSRRSPLLNQFTRAPQDIVRSSADLGGASSPDAVMQMDHAALEAALVHQLEYQAEVVEQGLVAASHHYAPAGAAALVHQTDPDRLPC